MIPYCYKIFNTITGQFYIGARTEIGCYPNEDYWSSSPRLRLMISREPEIWVKQILLTGDAFAIADAEQAFIRQNVGNPKLINKKWSLAIIPKVVLSECQVSNLNKRRERIAKRLEGMTEDAKKDAMNKIAPYLLPQSEFFEKTVKNEQKAQLSC